MTGQDRRVGVYIDRKETWQEELRALRAILLDGPLGETFKWRQPCYTHAGSNVAMIARMKDCCVLSFFQGVLLKDPEGILEPPGANSRSARVVRFKSVAGIEEKESALRALVREAAEAAEAGLKVEFAKDDLEYPEELVDRLDADDGLRAAFEGLTPGRRRGWVLHFSGAKQSATRTARIDRAAPLILDGKGMHDR